MSTNHVVSRCFPVPYYQADRAQRPRTVILDLAKHADRVVHVKLAGGRQGTYGLIPFIVLNDGKVPSSNSAFFLSFFPHI